MTDLHKERRRLNLELAALTEEAYDAWRAYRLDNPDVAPVERTQLHSTLQRIESLIGSKQEERTMVNRAITARERALWDERYDEGPGDEIDMPDGFDPESFNKPEIELMTPEDIDEEPVVSTPTPRSRKTVG